MTVKPKSKTQMDLGGDLWLKEFIPYILFRITNRLNLDLRENLRPMKISLGRWRVMSVLKAYGTCNVSELVAYTTMEQPTVSRVIAELHRDGFIKRNVAKSDSRIVEVRLTKQGLDALDQILPNAVKHQERALAGFSKEDVKTLKRLLRRIQQNIGIEL